MSILDVPAAPAQERLWSVVQAAAGEPIYHVAFQLVNDGPLDLETVRAVLRDLIVRHEALRTDFRLAGGVHRDDLRAQPPAQERDDLVPAGELDRLAERRGAVVRGGVRRDRLGTG